MSTPGDGRPGFGIGPNVLLPVMFFVSGFCGLLYQTVWMRLAFARFGVITPVVSVVVSVFMLGLGLGSWFGGKYARRLSERLRVHAILLYGAVEIVIGLGAFAVPVLFARSARLLLGLGESNSWAYLAGSGACLFVSILPFSCAMGATYPVALQFLEQLGTERRDRFGRLYAFNTSGAVVGVLVTIYVLVELLGLRGVLRVGFFGNLTIAVVAALWGRRLERPSTLGEPNAQPALDSDVAQAISRRDLTILFVTGFCSMAMEVGWVRSFTPVLDHAVYAFAFLLAAYLAGHALGAAAHAVTATRGASPAKEILVGATLVAASLPVLVADWEWAPIDWKVRPVNWEPEHLAIALSIGLFAAILGWLTPMLIDDISKGRPSHAGLAYAVNIAGCVLGPLVMGYAVLPFLGPRVALVLLCLPLAGLLAFGRKQLLWKAAVITGSAGILVAALAGLSFEEGYPLERNEVALYRDYTATTIATRSPDGTRSLAVNGVPMTTQSNITKMMAHLPFALHGSPPQKVLVICLGMGTTFRSALSWNVDVTVVELVPGVARALRRFEAELEPASRTTAGRIVIDDGRRFLARTTETFDVIIIDPPPPPQQPASSLLYSVEFYDLLKQHLNPGGVVQQWWGFPYADPVTTHAMVRSVQASFPDVRIFRAIDDHRMGFGFHFICSLVPVPPMTAGEFLARLPEGARRDLQEWSQTDDPEREMEGKIAEQLRLEGHWPKFLTRVAEHPYAPDWKKITDDDPINEYFYVRQHAWSARLLLGSP